MGGVHPTSVVIAEVAIVNGGVVSIHWALGGQLLLVGLVIGALSPRILANFSRKEWMGHGTLPLLLLFL